MSKDMYEVVNGKPKESFAEEFRYYDQGIAAYDRGERLSKRASPSWRDGWLDQREYIDISQQVKKRKKTRL